MKKYCLLPLISYKKKLNNVLGQKNFCYSDQSCKTPNIFSYFYLRDILMQRLRVKILLKCMTEFLFYEWLFQSACCKNKNDKMAR